MERQCASNPLIEAALSLWIKQEDQGWRKLTRWGRDKAGERIPRSPSFFFEFGVALPD